MKEDRRSVKDLAYGGLFTALIAAGAFLKITIPVQPVPMHFTLQFFFVLLAGLLLGSKGALSAYDHIWRWDSWVFRCLLPAAAFPIC